MSFSRCRRWTGVVVAVGVGAALAACADTVPVAPERTTPAPSPEVAPGQYIVLLRGSDASAAPTGVSAVRALSPDAARVRTTIASLGGEVVRTTSGIVDAVTAHLGEAAVAALRADPSVALVEPDPIVYVAGT